MKRLAEDEPPDGICRGRIGGLPHDGANGKGQWSAADCIATRPGGPGSVGFDDSSPASRLRAAQRLVAAGDTERQRIERDLHDGVQQRLTALRVRLELAAQGFDARGDREAGAALNELGNELEHATEELRAFAHGIYPAMLTSGGLGPALASAATRLPEHVSLLARAVRRYRPDVETAVYFSCLAAIDNAARHAGPAQVTVSIWDDGRALHFTIRDTGCGFAPGRTRIGAGMTNMRDRIAAVGGTLTVDSAPAQGTRVEGAVPHVS
jgi:signal transduction histidine kinase